MKAARWFTWIGSIVLFATAILHMAKFSHVEGLLQANAVGSSVAGIVKALWLIFAAEGIGVAIIALLASTIERGGRILIMCGLIMAVNAVLLVKFLGLFVGVYVAIFVMLMFLAGGFLMGRQTAAR